MRKHYNGRTMHRPDYSYTRYLAVGGEIYRNTAAEPDAPILCQIVPVAFPAQQPRR